jgi:hypothetical protein
MIRRRSSSSRRTVPTKRSAIAFARGARTGVLMTLMSMAVKTASRPAVNLRSRSRIRNRKRRCADSSHDHGADTGGDGAAACPDRPGGRPPPLLQESKAATSWEQSAEGGDYGAVSTRTSIR